MKNHTIDVNALQEFASETKVLFASSTKQDKKIYCNLRGGYEVWHKGVKVAETIQAYPAVEKYNSIN